MLPHSLIIETQLYFFFSDMNTDLDTDPLNAFLHARDQSRTASPHC